MGKIRKETLYYSHLKHLKNLYFSTGYKQIYLKIWSTQFMSELQENISKQIIYNNAQLIAFNKIHGLPCQPDKSKDASQTIPNYTKLHIKANPPRILTPSNSTILQ